MGILRMGAIPSSLPLIPLLIQQCLQSYPRMRHQIHTLSAAEIFRKIVNFELDLGLSYLDDARLAVFEIFPILQERYVLVAADATMFEGMVSMSWTEAANLPLCLFTNDMQCRRGMNVAFSTAGVETIPVVETDSMTALCAHVRRAGLYSILPHSALCLDDSQARLFALPLLPLLQRDIGLVMLKQQPSGPLLDAAMKCFRKLDLQSLVDGFLAKP